MKERKNRPTIRRSDEYKSQLSKSSDLLSSRLAYLHREYERERKALSRGWILASRELPPYGFYEVWLKIDNKDGFGYYAHYEPICGAWCTPYWKWIENETTTVHAWRKTSVQPPSKENVRIKNV